MTRLSAVPADRDRRRAARHLCAPAGHPLTVSRDLCACRIAARDARTRRRGALHGARDLQGHARLSHDARRERGIEGFGGSSNAATDRESTVYWARLPVREAERAFGVLGELVFRPLLREADITRERDIIVEEIRSYQDDPGQYVFNLFDRAFFGDTPLGWEIAGDEASVRGLGVDDIKTFWSDRYRPANMVVAVAGDLDHATVVDLVKRNVGTGIGGGAFIRRRPPTLPGHALMR